MYPNAPAPVDDRHTVFDPASDGVDQWEHYLLRAFGGPPESGVHAVALFTDNDDTGEPVSAYYGTVALHCGAAGA